MAELVPYPFAALVSRMFHELEQDHAIFDLPERKFFLGSDLDFSVRLHGRPASSPLGPAAGPHTQMAQNIVLSWLGGCRIFELKTVQINDELTIPRPCIDMRNVGYNAEWSQELNVDQSLKEYVKASMLIEILRGSGRLDLAPGFGDSIFDMSVGYDLEGIRSDKVSRFIEGMLDSSAVVERLRAAIPTEFGDLRDLEFTTRLSSTLTLSTFHGCPPDEIERIIDYLMRRWGLDCIVKFNPMLLGKEETRHLLHDVMGYDDVRVPDSAFDRDTTWPQAVEIVERLASTAKSLGLGFGVKFSNTLIVENRAGFLPSEEKEVYLSGPPLHVLAVNLVKRFRDTFGDTIPISFSAGIDWNNYADAVALGLVPITVCSDLLKTGGYGRLATYHQKLESAMRSVGARTIDEYIVQAHEAGETDVSRAKLANTQRYVARATEDPRYARAANEKMPPRIDSHLELFDCITCDKCIPVCPNDANFTFETGTESIPSIVVRGTPDAPIFDRRDDIALAKERQIATFADFCNECGNCDVFCPEEGGPYQFKPLFFGTEESWRKWSDRDGFCFVRESGHDTVLGRVRGTELRLQVDGTDARFSGDGFEVELDLGDPERSLRGRWTGEVDLTWCFIMDLLRRRVLDATRINYVSARNRRDP